MRNTFMTLALALLAGASSGQALAQDGQRGGGQGGWMRHDMTRDEAKQRADMMFERMDSNQDGVLTKDEATQAASQWGGGRGGDMIDRMFGDAQSLTLPQFEARSLARFDAEDSNHDGTVTAAEREQARQAGDAPPQQAPNPPSQ